MSEKELSFLLDIACAKLACMIRNGCASQEEHMAKKWRAMAAYSTQGGKRWLK